MSWKKGKEEPITRNHCHPSHSLILTSGPKPCSACLRYSRTKTVLVAWACR